MQYSLARTEQGQNPWYYRKNGKPSWSDRWGDRDGENRDIT